MLDYFMTGSEMAFTSRAYFQFHHRIAIYFACLLYLSKTAIQERHDYGLACGSSVYVSRDECAQLFHFYPRSPYTWFLGMRKMSASTLREIDCVGSASFQFD